MSSFFVKATIGALKAFPLLNAEIQGTEIVLKHYYDIGIAIGAEDGLVVPVLRGALAERTVALSLPSSVSDMPLTCEPQDAMGAVPHTCSLATLSPATRRSMATLRRRRLAI